MASDNDSQTQRENIFTGDFSDAMQMTPGRFVAMEGDWYRIESVEEDAKYGFRVSLIREDPPQGENPLAVFFFSGKPRVDPPK